MLIHKYCNLHERPKQDERNFEKSPYDVKTHLYKRKKKEGRIHHVFRCNSKAAKEFWGTTVLERLLQSTMVFRK